MKKFSIFKKHDKRIAKINTAINTASHNKDSGTNFLVILYFCSFYINGVLSHFTGTMVKHYKTLKRKETIYNMLKLFVA